MTIQEWAGNMVRDALLGDAGVASIVEARVYPLKIPQGTVLPCVTYQRYSSAPHMTLCGYGSETVTLLIVAYAVKYGQAKALANAVRAAMAGNPVNAVLRSDRDLYHEEADAYSVHMEFIVYQSGGYYHG